MRNEVFYKLSPFREFQAQYAAFRTEQPLVTAQVRHCATTARLEAIALKRCRWEGVSRDAITAFRGRDALTAPVEPRVPLSADPWPVSAVVYWSERALGCRAEAPGRAGSHGRRHAQARTRRR
jgi:hypothetical protein